MDRLARVGASLVYTDHLRKEAVDPLDDGPLARQKEIEKAQELEKKKRERRNTMAQRFSEKKAGLSNLAALGIY